MVTPSAKSPQGVEESYQRSYGPSHRKRYAQFFTPLDVADLMATWVVNSRDSITLLDPGSGTLVFERAVHKRYPHHSFSFDCYEIDPHILEFSKQHVSPLPGIAIRFLSEDYLLSESQRKYDGIISNPPYYKHHRIADKELTNAIVARHTSRKFSLSTSVHCLFLVKSMSQLSQNGRLAYIMPSEFLNANYGVAVKNYLLDSGFLRYILAFDYSVSVFPDALTTSSIILLANDDNNGCLAKLVSLNSIDELQGLHDLLQGKESGNPPVRAYSPHELDPMTKWKNYFSDQRELHMLVPFTKYARAMRGIATGCNRYFTLSREDALNHHIQPRYLQPCITRASDGSYMIFTEAMFRRLEDKGKRCNLLFLNDRELDDHVRAYLKHGERIGVDRKYLPSHRTPWYYSERRTPSPIWVTVFSREGLRFVRNETSALNLTCFHSVYLTEKGADNLDLLMAYLMSPICQEVFFKQRREYGNGLAKFEPNDLNESQILDLEMIRTDLKESIEAKYRMIREAIITGREGETRHAIEEMDSIFRALLGGGIDTHILQAKLI